MRTDTVIAHFGGVRATAAALGLAESTVRLWGDLVPPDTAIRAYCASNGELFLDPWLYHDWPRRGRVTKPLEDRRLKRNTHAPQRRRP